MLTWQGLVEAARSISTHDGTGLGWHVVFVHRSPSCPCYGRVRPWQRNRLERVAGFQVCIVSQQQRQLLQHQLLQSQLLPDRP